MKFLDFFRSSGRDSAAVAKERLQIIVAHERRRAHSPDFLPRLQKDILEVVRKYLPIEEDQIRLSIDSPRCPRTRPGSAPLPRAAVIIPEYGKGPAICPGLCR